MTRGIQRLTWGSGLQLLATATGLIGFAITIAGDLSRTQRFVLGAVLLASVTTIAIVAVVVRQPLRPIARHKMVARGKRLLEEDVHKSVVWFAGDMSWAEEYVGAITQARSQGKSVTILYPREKGEAAERNAERLKDTGARLVPTEHDFRLRAMLTDHEWPDDALLYVVNRVRRNAAAIEGGDEKAEYEGKIYAWKNDSVLISTATKLYELLDDESQ
jgi:hypothetical protein